MPHFRKFLINIFIKIVITKEKNTIRDNITEDFCMNDKEAMEYIESLNQYGSVLGLENMKELCFYLGNPQDDLKFIHIAGTNGKGSVLAFVSTILKTAGYKTGRYISPTIFHYREKIQINGKPITKKDLCECLEQIKEAVEQMQKEGKAHPTLFEIETAMAFLYFKKMECEIVVLETGLGGRLDATNIIETTLVSVFTSISMDHMQYLGECLEQIAEEKAGIMKHGPVISTRQKPEVTRVLKKKAAENNCLFLEVDVSSAKSVRSGIEKQRFSYNIYKDMEISLIGQYQIENAVLALEVIRCLGQNGYPVKEHAVRKGLKDTVWQGRFSVIAKQPYVIVDGAHNEDGAKKLAKAMQFHFTNRRIIYIMGVLRDKEYDKIIKETYELAEQIITVSIPGNARAMQGYELANEVRKYHSNVTAADSVEEAVELSYLLADKKSVIVAFGSLSYLGNFINIVENRDKIRSDLHGKSRKN